MATRVGTTGDADDSRTAPPDVAIAGASSVRSAHGIGRSDGLDTANRANTEFGSRSSGTAPARTAFTATHDVVRVRSSLDLSQMRSAHTNAAAAAQLAAVSELVAPHLEFTHDVLPTCRQRS